MTERELATVLAALRTFQEINDGESELVGLHEHFAKHEPLSNSEIDELCARLRQASPPPIDRGLLDCHKLLREVLEFREKPASDGRMSRRTG